MPTKLKVLVGLLGLSILLAGVSSSWVSLVLNILLLIGVLRGSEGVRGLLIGLAVLGLAGNAFVFVIAAAALAQGSGLVGAVALGAGIIGTAQCVYFIWCLRQRDVQSWMFRRKMGNLDV
jgi:hypothetical protein